MTGIPSLSDTVRRTCDTLRESATRQIVDYEQRFSAMENLYDGLLADLMKSGINVREANETANKFFGTDTVRFAAVDGTMYSRPLFDMVIFFGGAYASTGKVTFPKDAEPHVEYDTKTLRQGVGVSSVVPMYINEIPDVDQTFFSQEQPGELIPNKPLTDGDVAENTVIANSIMTFGEYYLAYKLASDPTQRTRIILLDRSLATERASLLYDTGKTELWKAKSSIFGYIVDDTDLDMNDLTIARQHVYNSGLRLPPPRADYLRHALICLAEKNGAFTLNQALSGFEIEDEKRKERVERSLHGLVQKGVFREENAVYSLSQRYSSTWARIKKLTAAIGESMFSREGLKPSGAMKIMKSGSEYWLTTLDISFLTLFALQMLVEECWERSILLIGVTKDTAARDFKRQLIPIMQNDNLLKKEVDPKALQELPNTDRMILQSASIFNTEKIQPPWSLVEYDSAFRTMLPDSENRKSYVRGAVKNKISIERAFLKTYIQLSRAKSDPKLRSNVLLIDRPAYAEFDFKPESTVTFWNLLSDGTQEPLEAILYKDKRVPNKLQNLAMSVLVAMAPENIPEAFGHNKALFIADKIAKWNYGQFKKMVDTTALWILNNHRLRRFIFYMSTFRERRTAFEQARRDSI